MKSSSPCCSGSTCCPAPEASRYPIPPPIRISSSMWANPELPASPQFNSPPSRSPPPKKDPPFTYSGANLNAIDFPVGGFGAGNVKISGDGTLQNYSNVNQPKASTVHMPNNFWGISAAPANSPTKTQSFVLASPETFTNHTCNLPSHEPASVSRAAVKRLQTLPGIKSFTLTGTYPTANLDYDITDFPLQVSMEAMSPCIPQDVKNSSLPCGYFTFTITNPTTTTHTVRLLQSQQNFIGWDGTSDCSSNSNPKWGGNVNTAMNTNEYTSMNMSNPTTPHHHCPPTRSSAVTQNYLFNNRQSQLQTYPSSCRHRRSPSLCPVWV